MAYHVFISYRRDGGDAVARLLYDRLKAEGYEPFFDVEQMRSGKFNEQLYARIAECEDFVLVLPPNALDRCIDEEDWVRREIQEAIRLKKNIVPFMLRGFTFPKNLPEEIKEVRDYQGVPASQDYFDSTIEKLKGLLLYKPGQDNGSSLADSGGKADQETAGAMQQEETAAHGKTHTIKIGNTVYEVDEGITRADIIARNKARRVRIGKTVLLCMLIFLIVSGLTLGLNLLLRGFTNRVLDGWLYADGQGTIADMGTANPVILMLICILPLGVCGRILSYGMEIESPTLIVLACILYILFMLVLHLIPKFILGLAALAFALMIVWRTFSA